MIDAENGQPPACNLAAMDAEERIRYNHICDSLRKAVKKVEGLPQGYRFSFDNEPELLVMAVRFVTLESRCCPFYHFTIEQSSYGGAIHLSITGPAGTRQFIEAVIGPRRSVT